MVKPSPADAHDAEGLGVPWGDAMVKRVQLMLMMLGVWGCHGKAKSS